MIWSPVVPTRIHPYLTHVASLPRRCRHKQADVAGTLAVPFALTTASVAAHRFQVRRKHEVYATQQGRIFLLSHRKYSALVISGIPVTSDGTRLVSAG